MARKPKRRVPKVPRSFIKSTPGLSNSPITPPTSRSSSGAVTSPSSVRKVVQPEVNLSFEYAHVKKDLMRITVFSTVLFGIMFGLAFVGF
jgi:hypothetical protein